MSVEVDLWQLVLFGFSLLGGVAGILWGFARIAGARLWGDLDKRFRTLEDSRATERDDLRRVERDLLQLRADLPLQYVRREDYVRGQSVIEAKLDGLATKIDAAQLRAALVEGRSDARN